MDPTQFKDPEAYDFKLFTQLANTLDLRRGDLIAIKGRWEARHYHNFVFNPFSIKKTGRNLDPSAVNYFY